MREKQDTRKIYKKGKREIFQVTNSITNQILKLELNQGFLQNVKTNKIKNNHHRET